MLVDIVRDYKRWRIGSARWAYREKRRPNAWTCN